MVRPCKERVAPHVEIFFIFSSSLHMQAVAGAYANDPAETELKRVSYYY